MNLGSESETVEFKKSTGEHKVALQAVSAMLNKHSHGVLYFGANDCPTRPINNCISAPCNTSMATPPLHLKPSARMPFSP